MNDNQTDLIARIFSRNPREHEALSDKMLVFVGVGSVGSTLAAMAARAGVGRFLLIDPDVFEPENICRHLCDLSDCGKLKVEAVSERILRVNPEAIVGALPLDLRKTDLSGMLPQLNKNALLVASTDSFACQSMVNNLSLEHNIPAVYVSCWGEAAVGEILYVMPRETACFECYAGFRRESEEISLDDPRKYTDPDFDQTKVPAQAGLGPNIQIICGYAFRVILAMLSPEAGHAKEILDNTRTLFLVNVADFQSPLPLWAASPATVQRGCGVCDPSLLMEEMKEA
jgi:hypothetical protein